jgi:large subunit ribosomal protein L21
MYAIVDIAGQQFKVEKDQKLYVHRLDEKAGAKVTFDKVMLIGKDSNFTVGSPVISGAAVSAKVLEQVKGDKVLVFKKKRRKGYSKLNGHRQQFTQIQITEIIEKGAKADTASKASDKPAAAKTATASKTTESKAAETKKTAAETKTAEKTSAPAKKPAAKKEGTGAAAKKTTAARKTTTAAKSATTKKAAADKPAAKKPAAKKPAAKKPDAPESGSDK